jgi:hypothetical protein
MKKVSPIHPSSLILHPCFCFRPGVGLLVKELNGIKYKELNVPVVPVKLPDTNSNAANNISPRPA